MQIKAKVLGDAGWKDVVAKNKVKDNGVQKALERLKRVPDDDHDEAEKILDELTKLIAQLKKDKAVASAQAVVKYLGEMSATVDSTLRDVAKAKAEHEKVKKAKAEADKKAAAEAARKGDEEEDDDEVAGSELLTTKLKPLLRLVAKGQGMHALVAKSGKKVKVLLSRKPISPARRKLLTEELGGGSTKFYPGFCNLEAGTTTFVLKAEVAGLSKLLKLALLEQTGLKVNRIKCRGEDGDDDDLEEDDDASAAADAAGGDEDEDTPAAPAAAPAAAASGGGDAGQPGAGAAPAAAPQADDEDDEASLPDIGVAPEIWLGTREVLEGNLDALKKAVRKQCEGEDAAFVKTIDGQLASMDRLLQKFDTRLGDALLRMRDAGDPAARAQALERAQSVAQEYIGLLQTEQLIGHLDKNPFGVQPHIKATLISGLTQVLKAMR